MNKSIAAILAAFIATLASTAAFAAKDPVYTGRLSNLAVDGHDVVAYFTESKQVKGSGEFKLDYNGAEWRFSSAENLATFKADPEKYAPQ